MVDRADQLAASVAEHFHTTYERNAPMFGYRTREASAVPWSDVPSLNRQLMISVAMDLIDAGIIVVGPALTEEDR